MNKNLSVSVSILQKKINTLFMDELGTLPIYPSIPGQLHFKVNEREIYDVVLMGDVLTLLATLSFGKSKPAIRLWCLCQKHAELLGQKFSIPLSHIGIIPRYHLFECRKVPRKFPRRDEPMTLVLSSRWAVHKHNESALKIADHIRKIWNNEVQIVHTFPDEKDLKLAKRFVSESGLENIDLLQLGKKWDSHIENKYINPVFMNFSVDLFEDFGVSLAQAEAKGWPCILSPWAAHLDATASWRIYQTNKNALHSKPIPPAAQEKTFSLPDEILFDDNLFTLNHNTMLELIFSRQKLSAGFDDEIRQILEG